MPGVPVVAGRVDGAEQEAVCRRRINLPAFGALLVYLVIGC